MINNIDQTYQSNRLSMLFNIQPITGKVEIQIDICVPNIKTITEQRDGINWNRVHRFKKVFI